jgi:hypothetical protein
MNSVDQSIKLIPRVAYGTPYKLEPEQSTRSKQAVMNAVSQRFPEFAGQCEPYVNVLTFQQWKARGYHVKKGEQSIRIPIMKEIEQGDGEKKEKTLVRKMAFLFALPQVEKDQ